MFNEFKKELNCKTLIISNFKPKSNEKKNQYERACYCFDSGEH